MVDGTEAGRRLRASDADRTATVEVLQDAMGRGLLAHGEGGDRMAAAFAARFTDELPPLTADLPLVAAPTAEPGWRHVGHLLAAQVRAEIHAGAGPRSRRILAAAMVAVLLLGILLTLAGHGLVDGGLDHHVGFGPR
jgi:hypothetical protein